MKVPLRGRGGKQDKLKESKSAFSLHSAVIYLNFLLPVRVRDVTVEPHTNAVSGNNSWMQLTMLCTTENGSNTGCYFLWQYGESGIISEGVPL